MGAGGSEEMRPLSERIQFKADAYQRSGMEHWSLRAIVAEVRALEERVSWAENETTKMGRRALAAEGRSAAPVEWVMVGDEGVRKELLLAAGWVPRAELERAIVNAESLERANAKRLDRALVDGAEYHAAMVLAEERLAALQRASRELVETSGRIGDGASTHTWNVFIVAREAVRALLPEEGR